MIIPAEVQALACVQRRPPPSNIRKMLRTKIGLRLIADNLQLSRRIVLDHAHCEKESCWLCGLPILIPGECGKLTYSNDHVVPRANGGSNWYKNLRPAHRHCNTVRGVNDPDAMLAARLRMAVLIRIRNRVPKAYSSLVTP